MRLTKQEYEEMIKKKPSLKPTEVIKNLKNTFEANQKMLNKGLDMCLVDGMCLLEVCGHSSEALDIKDPFGPIVPERSFIRPPAIKFTIFGDPVGKPRQTRADKWRKRPCVMRYRSWADVARASVPKSVDLGLYREISFIAWIAFPKSYSKKRRGLLFGSPHLERPDVDNICKSCLDALFPEDKLIWKFSGEKRWDDGQGSRIEVELR